ncbi:MAG: hypothetical protein Q8Q33_07555 [Chlamydiota bacterium]|nr:hypothetical protein [Chlamydiota bacterium]
MPEDKPMFEIGAEGVDVKAIMEKIRKNIEEKKKTGFYDNYDLSGISRLELESVIKEEEFLDYYTQVLQRTCDIDIGDFEIVNEGGIFGSLEVLAKKVMWKLLKFYTYRMFNQQKEFNCQMVNAFISLRRTIDQRFTDLEKRLDSINISKN